MNILCQTKYLIINLTSSLIFKLHVLLLQSIIMRSNVLISCEEGKLVAPLTRFPVESL